MTGTRQSSDSSAGLPAEPFCTVLREPTSEAMVSQTYGLAAMPELRTKTFIAGLQDSGEGYVVPEQKRVDWNCRHVTDNGVIGATPDATCFGI